jgi:hypothetical protein
MAKRASLATRSTSSKRTADLTKKLITNKAVAHMIQKGALARSADGCCKPDGGTCCPNKR